MKQQATIELNGIKFEIKKNVPTMKDKRELYECYGKPSNNKIRVYRYWLSKFYEMRMNDDNLYDGVFHGVYGFNCHMFTLCFEMIKDSKLYEFYITPSHNYVAIHELTTYVFND